MSAPSTAIGARVGELPGRRLDLLSSFRHRSGTSGGIGKTERLLWFGAIAGALGLGLGAAYLAFTSSEPTDDLVRTFATIAFYGLPLVAVSVWIGLSRVSRSVPVLADAYRWDNPEATRLVSRLVAERSRLLAERDRQYRIGAESGIPLTKGSGSTLFSRRYQIGREANGTLERVESDVGRLDAKIRDIRACVAATLPDWAAPIRPWIVTYAIVASLECAATVFALAFALVFLIEINDGLPAAFVASTRSLVWLPVALLSPAAGCVAYACAAVGALIAWTVLLQRLPLSAGGNAVSWRALEAKWSVRTDPRAFFWSDAEARASLGLAVRPDLEEDQETWYEVLCVLPKASTEQIRTAYREAIKSYHSDRVVGLGIKIREVAERESKRINAAYREAMQTRPDRRLIANRTVRS